MSDYQASSKDDDVQRLMLGIDQQHPPWGAAGRLYEKSCSPYLQDIPDVFIISKENVVLITPKHNC